MPQFQLITEDDTRFDALPEIVRGYIECAFFTNQCPADVMFTTQGGPQTVYVSALPKVEPNFTKEHWDHPDIQHAIREGQSDGEIPSDAGTADLSDETLETLKAHVMAWYEANRELADRAAAIYGMDRVGNDLWFTEGGHGCGFWDRSELGDLGDELADTVERAEQWVHYESSDGQVHFD